MEEKNTTYESCPEIGEMPLDKKCERLEFELKNTQRELNKARDAAERETMQKRALVITNAELYGEYERSQKDIRWFQERADDYRCALADIEFKCKQVIAEYQGTNKGRELQKFALSILDILNRF